MICILVRDFATTQEKRLNRGLPDKPLILIEAGKYRPKVIAPDAAARHAGIKAGMWAGEARSLYPEAILLPVDDTRYQRLFEDVTRSLLDVTDRIEPEYQATSAAWYCDDALMLPYLLQAIENATGILPQVGKAGSKFPARVAAAITDPSFPCEIAEGDEKAFLGAYPVSLLPLNKVMKRRLPLLGIETLGQLAELPRMAVREQFGKHGRRLHDLASGIDRRPLTLFKAPVMLSDTHLFDNVLADRLILNRHLEQISLTLVESLTGRQANRCGLLVTLVDGTLLEYHRHLNDPVTDHLYLLRLLTQMLDGLLIDAPVEQVEVRLSGIRERLPVQLSLFETQKPVMSLQQVAPEWASRYRQADFYHLHRNDGSFLPEDQIDRQHVSGA